MLNYLRRNIVDGSITHIGFKLYWGLHASILVTCIFAGFLAITAIHSHSDFRLIVVHRSPRWGSWQLGYLSVIAHRSTCHIDLCGSFSGLYQYVKELYFGALSGFSTAGQDCTGDLSSPLETLSRCWATAVVWFGWLTATWWGCSVFGQWQLHLSWRCCTFPRTRCSS